MSMQPHSKKRVCYYYDSKLSGESTTLCDPAKNAAHAHTHTHACGGKLVKCVCAVRAYRVYFACYSSASGDVSANLRLADVKYVPARPF